MKIGKELRQLRSIFNVSQQDVADWLGVKQSFVSQYENDKREPKTVTIRKIADAFERNGIPLLESLSDEALKKAVFYEYEYKKTKNPSDQDSYIKAKTYSDGIIDEIYQAQDIISNLRIQSIESLDTLFRDVLDEPTPGFLDVSDLTFSEIEELKKYKEFLIFRRE